MSFSLYLVHNPIIFFMRPMFTWAIQCTHPNYAGWAVFAFLGVLTIVISSITYRFIEYPMIVFERNLRRKDPAREKNRAGERAGAGGVAARSRLNFADSGLFKSA